MSRPRVHLICNAHLDPVWQWRWEEGCSEALSTFATAADLLNEHDQLIFNHNESILYRWVEQYDPGLFEQIRQLVAAGRWFISGGWYLQPDANLPGLESFVRHIAEGRKYFRDRFDSQPRVAYNFDSFGHHGGLPQVLRRAGFEMYIHMRPEARDLNLPSDFYRWEGVDGSEVLALRIAIGLYHTEYDNMEQRLREGTEMALRLNRDVPVFWGLGNHGGGATRKDLEIIDAFIANESRVEVIHSTPDRLLECLRPHAAEAPIVRGDIQRVFTGCYTSLSRLKRRARTSLAGLVQSEALCTAAWWNDGREFPADLLNEIWRDHLFNDFHDILPGTCTEPAERDALDLYGRVSESARRVTLAATIALNTGEQPDAALPVAVANTNPAATRVPIEVEFMVDHRPLWTGQWHTRLFASDGSEITSQEEQPDARLPFHEWRRKLVLMADLPGIGVANYHVQHFEGKRSSEHHAASLTHSFNAQTGLVNQIHTPAGQPCLAGPLLEPIVVFDQGDSWGTNLWEYNAEAGRFHLTSEPQVTEQGPVRTITQSQFCYETSHITLQTIAYSDWPVLEFRYLVKWNEIQKRLKLAVPTLFRESRPECEVPGGAIIRPNDGDQHVHGRWLMLAGEGESGPAAIGIVNSGQHGIDCRDGRLTLSVLRSAAYCHERGQSLDGLPATRFMDQGEHEFRLLVIAGNPEDVRSRLAGLADWLDRPPAVYSHLRPVKHAGRSSAADSSVAMRYTSNASSFVSVDPPSVRLSACKKADTSDALVLRLQESTGESTTAHIAVAQLADKIVLPFKPFEIKTVRIERNGAYRTAQMIEEV